MTTGSNVAMFPKIIHRREAREYAVETPPLFTQSALWRTMARCNGIRTASHSTPVMINNISDNVNQFSPSMGIPLFAAMILPEMMRRSIPGRVKRKSASMTFFTVWRITTGFLPESARYFQNAAVIIFPRNTTAPKTCTNNRNVITDFIPQLHLKPEVPF